MRLPRRIEDAVGPRVGSRPGDPLPVPDVVRHVAVDEVLREVGRALPPVQVEVLREERRGDEPCPVVHRALGAELPHPCVHDRVPRLPLPPCCERVRVVAPAIVTRTEVVPRDPGVGLEQLMMEVAPAELARERLAAGLAGRALRDLER